MEGGHIIVLIPSKNLKISILVSSIVLILLLLILGRFATVSWNHLLLNANSADGDQSAYLRAGLLLQEEDVLTDGKRPPLYPLLLSTFARREWAYFTWAKIVNIGLGCITVLATYLVGRRLYDRPTALLAALLLGVNAEFLFHSTFVLAEPLLILLILIAWFLMVRALQQPSRVIIWIMAGLFTGAATLTKGTGPIFAVAFLLVATLLLTPRVWLRRPLWGFIIGVGVVTLPLWLYNTFTFGAPFFNAAINNVMWMDSAEEKYVADSSELPTIQSFLEQTSLSESWERLWSGLQGMRFIVVKTLWPTRSLTLDQFLLAGGLDILLLLALLVVILARHRLSLLLKPHRESLLLTAVLFAAFYLLFGWYMAIAPYPVRFLLPLSPPIFLLLAAGLMGGFRAITTQVNHLKWGRPIIGLLVLTLGVGVGQWFFISWADNARAARNSDPFGADAAYNQSQEQALLWAKQGHSPSEQITILWGPSHNVPTWRQSNDLNFLRTPLSMKSVADLEAFSSRENVTYIIIDDDMLRRRRDLAKDLPITRLPGERLAVDDIPTGWALGMTIPGDECRWCVFRRLPPDLATSDTITPTTYMLADNAISLLGYELDDDNAYPGGQLDLILYWQSQQPVTIDYTVFNQLLGPDFQLHGQVDRQPLAGHWPTSRWKQRQRFVDKFRLPIDTNAPAGTYSLLVGLYDLETGQRALATMNGQPLPDNAIVLHQLHLITDGPLTLMEGGTNVGFLR